MMEASKEDAAESIQAAEGNTQVMTTENISAEAESIPVEVTNIPEKVTNTAAEAENIPVEAGIIPSEIEDTPGAGESIQVVTESVQVAAEVSARDDPDPGYKLVLHTFPPAITAPSASPFVLKLETYMRMAGIKYTINTDKPFGSKGKTPWITFNGEGIDDSQIIIDFLNKKLNKDLWGTATKEEKATAQAMRIMLENHFILGLADWRWVTGVDTAHKIMALSGIRMWALKMWLPRRVKRQLYDQGFGRHTKEQQMEMIKADLVAISDYLGDKPFFLGEEPTEIDATLFGVMAQYVYCAPGSPYEKIILEEYHHLKAYCERMKERFWKDWDSLLHK